MPFGPGPATAVTSPSGPDGWAHLTGLGTGMENGGSRQVSSHDPRQCPFQGCRHTNSQRVSRSENWIRRGREIPGAEDGLGVGCVQRSRKDGEAAEKKERVTAILGGDWAGSGPADRRKEGGWEGGESSGRPTALGGHRRHGAGGPERAARRPRGDGDATRDSPWLGVGRRPILRRVGRRGASATASLPALGLAGSGCRTARTAAAAPSVRSLARSLARAPRPRGPAREGRDGRLHRPAQPGTPAETPPPSQASPPLPSLSAASPPRPAPHPPRTAQPRTPRVSRVFSLCGIVSALALDAAEISRLGPRLSSGQKPSSISKTHDASPSGPWPGLARSWGPDPLTCSGSL